MGSQERRSADILSGSERDAAKGRANGHPVPHSDSKLLRWRLGEQWHDLPREAAQALVASCAATGAAAVEQHIANPRFAQRLEPLGNLVGCSVDRADFVDHARITGGPVGPAMNGAVRPRRPKTARNRF